MIVSSYTCTFIFTHMEENFMCTHEKEGGITRRKAEAIRLYCRIMQIIRPDAEKGFVEYNFMMYTAHIYVYIYFL